MVEIVLGGDCPNCHANGLVESGGALWCRSCDQRFVQTKKEAQPPEAETEKDSDAGQPETQGS